jgi:Multiubiquitin
MSDETTASTTEAEQHPKQYRIFVNTVEKIVTTETVSYEEIVQLAFPTPTPGTIYSVDFEKAKEPKEGELFAGQSVEARRRRLRH